MPPARVIRTHGMSIDYGDGFQGSTARPCPGLVERGHHYAARMVHGAGLVESLSAPYSAVTPSEVVFPVRRPSRASCGAWSLCKAKFSGQTLPETLPQKESASRSPR